MTRRLVAFVAAVLAAAVSASASDVAFSGGEGHPRDRFPLTVHLGASGEPSLDAAARRTLGDWNAVSEAAIGVRVFRDAETAAGADVVVGFHREAGGRLMGATRVDTHAAGVIGRPVQVTLFPLEARGQTTREVLVYQVLAHELGHALGLPHTRDPRSLMCCVSDGLDFNDPAVREAYVAARRQPDIGSVAAQLRDHYTNFWRRHP